MNDPMASGLLPHPLLNQGLLRAEQLHGQLVVGGLEDVLQLVPDPPWLGFAGHRDAPGTALGGGGRGHLFFGRAVKGNVVLVSTKVNLGALCPAHGQGQGVGEGRGLVLGVEVVHPRVDDGW